MQAQMSPQTSVPVPAIAGCPGDRPTDAPESRPILRFRSGTLHENWYIAALSKQVTAKKPYAVTIYTAG